MNPKKTILVYVAKMNVFGGKERVVSNLMYLWEKEYRIILLTKDKEQSTYDLPRSVRIESLGIDDISKVQDQSTKRMVRVIRTLFSMIESIVLLRKKLKNIQFDYIYTTTPLESFEVFAVSKKYCERLVVSEHASINSFNKVYSLMKKIVYPKAYFVSVPNKSDTKEYKKWGCNAKYIPHPLTFFASDGNSLENKCVLNVGRLTADKRQDILLHIWSKINNKNGWKLLIVGDGEDKEKLERLANSLDLDDSVSFIGASKDIDKIYRASSLFVLTSRSEGFGMVLLEAMAFGIPCISFDCPSGPRDIIDDGVNGYLIENGDIEEFSLKLQDCILMKNEDLLELGKNALNKVLNWDSLFIAEQWRSIYK